MRREIAKLWLLLFENVNPGKYVARECAQSPLALPGSTRQSIILRKKLS
ncbi:MAG: hypothetical protein WCA28_25955 [Bradyrhizobium sp.]